MELGSVRLSQCVRSVHWTLTLTISAAQSAASVPSTTPFPSPESMIACVSTFFNTTPYFSIALILLFILEILCVLKTVVHFAAAITVLFSICHRTKFTFSLIKDLYHVSYGILYVLCVSPAQPLVLECEVMTTSDHIDIDCRTNRPPQTIYCSFSGGPKHLCMFHSTLS